MVTNLFYRDKKKKLGKLRLNYNIDLYNNINSA